jgi:heme oxygenase
MSTLKELTAEIHAEAESQPFIKSIFDGTVDPVEYAKYLYQLAPVYHIIEREATFHSLLKDIEDIRRATLVYNDCEELTPADTTFTYNKATVDYISYLQSEEFTNDPTKVMAHLYVRHMGDLFGGQMLATKLPGSCSMYKFNNLRELITKMRERIDVSLADEAIKAFRFNINIIKEL